MGPRVRVLFHQWLANRFASFRITRQCYAWGIGLWFLPHSIGSTYIRDTSHAVTVCNDSRNRLVSQLSFNLSVTDKRTNIWGNACTAIHLWVMYANTYTIYMCMCIYGEALFIAKQKKFNLIICLCSKEAKTNKKAYIIISKGLKWGLELRNLGSGKTFHDAHSRIRNWLESEI